MPSLIDEFYFGVLKGRHGKPRLLVENALAKARAIAQKGPQTAQNLGHSETGARTPFGTFGAIRSYIIKRGNQEIVKSIGVR